MWALGCSPFQSPWYLRQTHCHTMPYIFAMVGIISHSMPCCYPSVIIIDHYTNYHWLSSSATSPCNSLWKKTHQPAIPNSKENLTNCWDKPPTALLTTLLGLTAAGNSATMLVKTTHGLICSPLWSSPNRNAAQHEARRPCRWPGSRAPWSGSLATAKVTGGFFMVVGQ